MNLLIVAVTMELIALAILKASSSFLTTSLSISILIASYFVFQKALYAIELNSAYALWAGLGIVGTTAIGYFAFSEVPSRLELLFIATILVGIIGLAWVRVLEGR